MPTASVAFGSDIKIWELPYFLKVCQDAAHAVASSMGSANVLLSFSNGRMGPWDAVIAELLWEGRAFATLFQRHEPSRLDEVLIKEICQGGMAGEGVFNSETLLPALMSLLEERLRQKALETDGRLRIARAAAHLVKAALA